MKPIDFPIDKVLRIEASGGVPATKGIRVCVSGGRTFNDLGFVWSNLDTLHGMPAYMGGRGPIREIGFGDADGVDDLAWKWAHANGVPWVRYVADWDRLGHAAGSIRNGVMLADFKPRELLVFPGGTGTTDCARKARKWHIKRTFLNPVTDLFEEASKWG